MNKIYNPLYITYSNQRVRALKNELSQTTPFAQVMTLSSLLETVFKQNNHSSPFPTLLGSSLIYQFIKEGKIEYFSYLNTSSSSLQLIYDFLLLCNRNSVSLELFCKGEKLNALVHLNTNYKVFKQKHNAYDISDVETFCATHNDLVSSFCKKYSDVYIDSFDFGEISFIQSKNQEQVLANLTPDSKVLSRQELSETATQYIPKEQPFDALDEVKTSLKIVRSVLDNGAKSSDVLVVCTDINLYAPLYRLLLEEYKLKGFDSLGRSLKSSQEENRNMVQEKLTILKQQAMFFNLNVDTETLKENVLNSSYVLDDKVGIELTEANQLIGSSKKYSHIIFLGVDISKFPPKQSDNFLYTQEEAQTHFYENSYYESSLAQYQLLKSLCDHLYIISASHDGKKPLAPSIIIDNPITHSIDLSSGFTEVEGYKNGKVKRAKEVSLQDYYDSISSPKMTRYDGLDVKNIKSNHLSASQINSYQSCPLKYLYSNKYRVEAPKEESEGFDASEKGTLMHSCFESFAKEVQGEKKLLHQDALMVMKKVLTKEYDNLFEYDAENNPKPFVKNIHHEIVYLQLSEGLDGEASKGVLAKFVDYYMQERETLNYFSNSQFELPFALDDKLNPTSEEGGYFIKGFIDRVDDLASSVNIIDYKSKKATSVSGEKLEDISTFKDVQLGLYMLYTHQQSPHKEHTASLLTFNSDKPFLHFAKLSSDENEIPLVRKKATGVLFDKKYEDGLKQRIFEVKEKIEKGEFTFDNLDEKVCNYCEIKHLCHQSVLHKKVENE